jgi:hypothetical protein
MYIYYSRGLFVLGLFCPRSVGQQKLLLAFNLLNLVILEVMDPVTNGTEHTSGQKVTRDT